MRTLDRQKLARRAAKLTGGYSRTAAAASAVVMLAVVFCAGTFLARRVRQFEPGEGTLLAELGKAGEGARMTQVLADPESAALLFAYIDAMGEGVTNMEISPKWSLAQFTALLAGAQAAQAELRAFAWEPGGQALRVECAGGAAQRLVEELLQSKAFAGAQVEWVSGEDGGEYTIECQFT